MSTELYYHPEYESLDSKWQIYDDLHDGDDSIVKQSVYLWPHDIERLPIDAAADAYRNRVQRTQYTNWIEPVLNIWTQLFFKKDLIIPESVELLFDENIRNVDGHGKSLASFFRDCVLQSELKYGRAFVLTDAFPMAAQSRAQELEIGARPFMESINPRQVTDWAIESEDVSRLGKLNAFRYEFELIRPRARLTEEPVSDLWSKEFFIEGGRVHYVLYRQDISESGKQNVGTRWKQETDPILIPDIDEIPVAHEMAGTSWLRAVAPLQLKYYNMDSNLDNVRYYQGYQVKYITGAGGIKPDELKMGANITLFLNDGASAGAFPEANTQSLENGLDTTLNALWKVALAQPFQVASNSKAVQAADTQREQRDNTNSLVQARKERLEDVINESIKHFAMFLGEEPPEERVEISADIDDQDVERAAELYQSLRPDLGDEAKRQFIKYLINDVPFEDPKAIADELEQMSFQSVGAGIGQAGARGRNSILEGFLRNGGEGAEADQEQDRESDQS